MRLNAAWVLPSARHSAEASTHPQNRKGEGPGVLEIVKDYDGDTYRAVYTVRVAEAVYVLHAFQKKSTHGIATRQSDVELIQARLRQAQNDYERKHG